MLRFETLVLTALLAVPVVGLWLRGDFTDQDAAVRLGYCLLAAWVAVSVLRFAAAPRTPVTGTGLPPVDDEAPDTSPAPADDPSAR